ncbi:M1 family metallopeptidase [Flavobacteriaceae bacterium F89]|uniref:Aminopeptidase N n=1 Tax=Cerina litoralis TaxID=2874477 RepID=A0AAE3EV72_9FLAO|nr:M1 family metallopeptidase [Cerina litoralis]MCG2460794.1 M1 family metallopeptidase [Cerina litoralis]
MKLRIFIGLLLLGICVQAQHQDRIHFTHADVSIAIDPYNQLIKGSVVYDIKVVQSVDSVFLDAKNMQFSAVLLAGKKVRFSNDGKFLTIKKKLRKGKEYQLSLTYSATPQQTVYFIGWPPSPSKHPDSMRGRSQIWTQGQGKYTSHWLPSFDDMNEKVEFDMDITFNKNYDVIANGELRDTRVTDSLKTWFFDMEHPMSSYLLAFAIGHYKRQEAVSTEGVPLQMYYYPQDTLEVEPTYRYSKRIFDFMVSEIGVAYPWQNYKQIPVRDFLYAGMENTGTTIFSDGLMIDSVAFVDRNYVNVNAHELAHQWFGDMVTEVDGHHHWLQEGFATYYALLAEKEIFGDAYFYWKLYDSALELQKLSNDGKGKSLTDPKASSLTFYDKGAWALVMLRDLVGDIAFKKGIHNYLKKYQFKNVTISDFLVEMERASGKDLSVFKDTWLIGTAFPDAQTRKKLMDASPSIASFYALQHEMTASSGNDGAIVQRYWKNTNSGLLKKRIVERYLKTLSADFIRQAFASDDIEIRQALAVGMDKIPTDLKPEFESLLNDKSYVTTENALYKLWIYFPGDRGKYLDSTQGIVGFANKNVRLLWLTLALLTKDYHENKKPDYYRELSGYTAPRYSFEVRQGAFQYLDGGIGFSDQNLKDLINACIHHNWQFKKYGRGLLDRLMEIPRYKKRLIQISKELKGKELRYISNKLDKE